MTEEVQQPRIIFITGAGGSGKSFLTRQASDKDFLKIDFDREAEDPSNFMDLANFIYQTLIDLGFISSTVDFNVFNEEYSKILAEKENKADKAVAEFLAIKGITGVDVYNSVIIPAYKKLFIQTIITKSQLPSNTGKIIIVDVGGRKLSCLGKDFEAQLAKAGIMPEKYITLDPGIDVITQNISSDNMEVDDQGICVTVFAKRRAFAASILEELRTTDGLKIYELEESMLNPLDKQFRDGGKEISCDILTRITEQLKSKKVLYDKFMEHIQKRVRAEVTASYLDFQRRLERLKEEEIKFSELKSSNRKQNVDDFCEIIKPFTRAGLNAIKSEPALALKAPAAETDQTIANKNSIKSKGTDISSSYHVDQLQRSKSLPCLRTYAHC